MAAYTQDRYAGPPVGGRYLFGDTVADMHGTVWKCVGAGQPGIFVAQTDPDLLDDSVDLVGVAADADGYADDATGTDITLAVNSAGDGLAHPVTVTYAGVEDLSALVLTLSGTDANGSLLSEDVPLPNGADDLVTEASFLTLASALLTTDGEPGDLGVETIDIGWASIRPEPSAALRGKFRLEPQPGAADKLLICIDGDGAGAYEWATVTLS